MEACGDNDDAAAGEGGWDGVVQKLEVAVKPFMMIDVPLLGRCVFKVLGEVIDW